MVLRRRKKIIKVSRKTKTVKKPLRAKKAVTKSNSEGFGLALEQISEYIRTRAYYIWEEMGKPHGQDESIWKQAEEEIASKLNKK